MMRRPAVEWRWRALCVTLIAAALLSACARGDQGGAPPDASALQTAEAAAASGALVSSADVTGNLAAYVGKTVSVRGRVNEVHGPSALELDDLLVVSAPADGPPIDGSLRNREVTVTGAVRLFADEEFTDEWSWLRGQGRATQFDMRPTLVAESIAAPGDGG